MIAVKRGHYRICQLLLEHGSMVELPEEANVCAVMVTL